MNKNLLKTSWYFIIPLDAWSKVNDSECFPMIFAEVTQQKNCSSFIPNPPNPPQRSSIQPSPGWWKGNSQVFLGLVCCFFMERVKCEYRMDEISRLHLCVVVVVVVVIKIKQNKQPVSTQRSSMIEVNLTCNPGGLKGSTKKGEDCQTCRQNGAELSEQAWRQIVFRNKED